MGCLDLPVNFKFLAGKVGACTLTWGESADPADAGSLEKTPFANQASNPATPSFLLLGSQGFLLLGSQRYSRETSKFWLDPCKHLSSLCSCLGKRREQSLMLGSTSRLLQSQPGHQFTVTQKLFNFCSFPLLSETMGKLHCPICWLALELRTAGCYELLVQVPDHCNPLHGHLYSPVVPFHPAIPELGPYFVIKPFSLVSRKMCSPHITAVKQIPATLWQPFPLTVLL